MSPLRAVVLLLLLSVGASAQELPDWLALLSAEQREQASFDFDADERTDWSYFPWGHEGLALGDMNRIQRTALDAVLDNVLSDKGRATVNGVLALEQGLFVRARWFAFMRDPKRYRMAVFKHEKPEVSGWRFSGHHLALNVTRVGDSRSVTPFFIGANPAKTALGLRLLGPEQDVALELIASFDDHQRQGSEIANRAPRDIVTGSDPALELDCCEGLPASELNTAQRQRLSALIDRITGRVKRSYQTHHDLPMTASELDRVHFAWAGDVDTGFYYRLHSPTLLIEYINTQADANHAHLVWRDPQRDFGASALSEHLRQDPH